MNLGPCICQADTYGPELNPQPLGKLFVSSSCEEPASGPALDTESAGDLILAFLAVRTVKNKFLLFISHLVCGVLLTQHKQNQTINRINSR